MFHLSTINDETYVLLKEIFSIPEIKNNFALAGGTSLALQIGHRVSIDLDIFSPQQFDTTEIEIILSSHKNWKFTPVNKNSRMLFCYINDIKCDFVHEPATILKPFIIDDGVSYFDVEDIAAMKMHTICGRGKRNFFLIFMHLYKNLDVRKCCTGLKENTVQPNITIYGAALLTLMMLMKMPQ